MSEWWTYSLSDFLMFSARSYYRQFELMNRELWPLHLLVLAAGLLLLACMRPRPAGSRVAFAVLALAWVWVGWAYHAERYADINTGAPWFAVGFGVQALLLMWMALRGPAEPRAGVGARLARFLLVLGLAAWPLLAPLGGRNWMQAEVFGFAPDPTVAATLGALLFWRAPMPVWIIPLAWCAISSATLFQLRTAQAWAPALLALFALAIHCHSIWWKASCEAKRRADPDRRYR